MTRRLKMWIPILCMAVLLTLGSDSLAAAQDAFAVDANKIDTFITQEMAAGNVPGLAVGIVRGDKIIYLKGFGTAGPGRGIVTEETAFMIGSVSKTFTGLAIMQLAEKGSISLDAPVKQYLPWFSIGGEDSGDILINQLLNHTSGIPAWEGNDSGVENGTTIEDRIRLKHIPHLAQPVGSVFEYSSLNYDILGAVTQAFGWTLGRPCHHRTQG